MRKAHGDGVFSVIPAHAGIQDRPPRETRGCSGVAGRDAGATAGSSSGSSPAFYLKVPHSQRRAPLAWCHGCAQLIRAGPCQAARSSLQFTMPVVFIGYESQARMSPAGRNTSVAPDSVAALSCSVVTDRS
jgi:hypothetical protein